jgi:hypothetical protein
MKVIGAKKAGDGQAATVPQLHEHISAATSPGSQVFHDYATPVAPEAGILAFMPQADENHEIFDGILNSLPEIPVANVRYSDFFDPFGDCMDMGNPLNNASHSVNLATHFQDEKTGNPPLPNPKSGPAMWATSQPSENCIKFTSTLAPWRHCAVHPNNWCPLILICMYVVYDLLPRDCWLCVLKGSIFNSVLNVLEQKLVYFIILYVDDTCRLHLPDLASKQMQAKSRSNNKLDGRVFNGTPSGYASMLLGNVICRVRGFGMFTLSGYYLDIVPNLFVFQQIESNVSNTRG